MKNVIKDKKNSLITNKNINFEIFCIKVYKNNCLNLFSCNDEKELINKIKKLDYNSDSVCARKMKNVGGWKCSDCEKNSNSILCQQCWSKVKNKHLNHEIIYNSSTNGTCDCGDPNTVGESLFCPYHKGPLTKEEDIQIYIKKYFSQELIQSFEKYTEKLLKVIAPYIINNIENYTIDIDFKGNIKIFLLFINSLSDNKALMHILSKLFLKNYKIKTKHNCLFINKNEMKFIKKNEEHFCTCPFIRILMSVWTNDNQDILFKFLLNYQLRKTIGILYFLLFEHFTKYCIEDFCELSAQYIFEDVCISIATIPGLIGFYFESIFLIIKYFTNDNYILSNEDNPLIQKLKDYDKDIFNSINFNDSQKYNDFKEIMQRICYDNIYLIKPESAKYLGNNEIIYLKFIDILSLFHNMNSIIAYYPHKIGFYKDSFNSNIIMAEYYILMIFDFYISILNFDNNNIIQNIFKYFSYIITNQKYKILEYNEYSFHLILFRGFSIFLTRYCFHYINSIKSQDLNDGFKKAINFIPNYQKFGNIIINEMFKLFGYINACGENFLNYYGELIQFNEVYYFEQNEFILRDFALLRFLLSDNTFQSSFSILTIFKALSLENTYKIMDKHFLSGTPLAPNINFLEEEDNYKYMKFNGKILKLILNIIRDNKSLLWEIGNSYQLLKNGKMSNQLTQTIILNDKENIKEICKNIIINEIVSKENLADYTDIMGEIFESIKDVFGEEKTEELIFSMTSKTLTLNKKAKFSVKDEYLQFLDISSVYNYKKKSNIQKYINDFKKDKISIYNTYFYPFIKYENKLQNNIVKNFFINQGNFNAILKLTELLLSDEKYFIFQQFFLSDLINFWNIFFFIYEKNKNDQEYKSFIINNKENIEKLVNLLINNTLTDNSIKDYCSSLVAKIRQNKFLINLIDSHNISLKFEYIKDNKINKNSLKEIMKDKFKKKYAKLDKIYNIESIKNEKKVYESCIYCLKPIEENNINNLYGQLGYIIKDYLFSNAFYQTVQNEYFKYNINKKDFFEISKEFIKKKGFNIYSCNHFIHISCFMKLLENSGDKKCPLCHQNVNVFIPSLCQYNIEDFYILKGYNLINTTSKDFTISNMLNNNFIISLSEKERNIQKLTKDKQMKINELIIFSKKFIGFFIQNIVSNELDYKKITENIIDNCSESMCNFFDFIENYNNKKIKLEYYKNLILAIRLLMKLGQLDCDTAFNMLILLLKKLSSLNFYKFCNLIFEDNLKLILIKILFILCVLFDYKTIKGYEKYIMKLIINLYTIQYFIRNIIINNGLKLDLNIFKSKYKENNFNQFLKFNKNIENILIYISKNIMLSNLVNNNNNSNNIDIIFNLDYILDAINLSNYKSSHFSNIIIKFNLLEKQNSNNIDLFFAQFFPKTKIKDFFIENYFNSINNYININDKFYKKCKKYINPFLLCSCLPIGYKFINLPLVAIDFQYIIFDFACSYCKSIGYPSFICLTCGKKVCNKKENICKVNSPIIKHNEECGGGRSIFINTFNYKVILVEKNNIYNIDIPLYVNKFGESIESNTTNKTYKLNKEEINKALEIFINYSWTNNNYAIDQS